MKILQLVQKPQRRGAEVFAYQLAGWLKDHGEEVTTAYLHEHASSGKLPLREGDVILLERRNRFLQKLSGSTLVLWRLIKTISEFGPDIIQLNGGSTLKYGAFAAAISRSTRGAFVYRNIGEPERWIRTRSRLALYKKLILPQIDGIIAVSNKTFQSVMRLYSPTVPIVHIHGGIDSRALKVLESREEIRAGIKIPAGAPLIVFVGSLTLEKRLDRFFRIVWRIKPEFPELRLWIIGEGPCRAKLEDMVSSLNLQVDFLGAQERVASWIAAADLLVLTSDTEGVPAALLEAGYLGIPVVATAVGGVPEAIQDGRTGFLVHPSDEESFAARVAHLLRSPKLREEMGANARVWIQQHFELDVVGQKYLNFYKEVIESSGNGKAGR